MRVYNTLAEPDMFEFTLHRQDLLDGIRGGLRPTGPDHVNYFDLSYVGFETHSRRLDPLHGQDSTNPVRTPVVMNTCVVCHAGPGIYGLQSMFAGHHERLPLVPMTLQQQVAPVIERNNQTYTWGLLQGLWESGTAN